MSVVRRFQVGLAIALLAVSAVLVLRSPDLSRAQTAQSSPTIASISPPQGPSAGGTSVTITGTDFKAGLNVFIGGRPATNVAVVSPTQINAVTPQAVSALGGGVNVMVQNTDGGVVTLNGAYFYLAFESPLALTGVDPIIGPNSGGTQVTITGTGFNAAASVYFNGVPAAFANPLGGSAMFVRTPSNVTGPVTITIVNPDGATVSRANGFTYTGGINVSRAVPAGGAVAGGTTVTVFGDGFRPGATVKLGDVPATSVIYVNSSQLVVKSAPSAIGTSKITVTNPGGENGSGGGFTYGPLAGTTPPVITGLLPLNGTSQGGTQVTLTGTGFSGGAAVYFGGSLAPSVSFNGPSSLFVRTPPQGAGLTSVTIVNSDGSTMTLPNAFTFEGGAPVQLQTVSPSTGPAAGGTVVTIGGNGFNAGSWVTFNGIPAATLTVVGSTQIVATTPAGLSGSVSVEVTQVGGPTGSKPNGFTFTGTSTTPPPTTTPPITTPPVGGTGSFAAAPIFSTSGQALVIFTGGTVDQLEGAAVNAKATGVWMQDSTGAYQLLVIGGPAFLKDQFKAKFPSGFAGNTPATVTR